MASTQAGSARCAARRRLQSAIDVLASIVIAMIVWPFPIARVTMSLSAQVIGILIVMVLAHGMYFVAATALWGQTLGMRLAGVRVLEVNSTRPAGRPQLLRWALLSSLIAWWFVISPTSACAASVAENQSGVAVDYRD